MDRKRTKLNWSDLPVVIAVARHGTIRAAAIALGVSHATIARKVESAEAALGANLFVRGPRGYQITEVGRSVLQNAERMENSAIALTNSALDSASAIKGEVRVSLPDFLLPAIYSPHIGALLEQHPELSLNFTTRNELVDLMEHDADIVVRFHNRPHVRLVGRRIGENREAPYASPGFWKSAGLRRDNLAIVGWTDVQTMMSRASEFNLTDPQIIVQTNDLHAQAAFAAAGVGVALLPTLVGQAAQGLERMPETAPISRQTVWVLTHPDLKNAARIRTVMAFRDRPLRQALQGPSLR